MSASAVSGLQLYTNTLSPVCRSVMSFMKMNSIPHTLENVDVLKAHTPGETLNNAGLAAANPNKAIPAINDNGFTMFESNAIMRYLSSKYNTPDHWYPSNPQRRAKVDEALDWFHGNLRCGCFLHTAILPVLSSQPRDEVKCAELREKLKKSLDINESYFLKDRKFVAGDQISVADLSFFGEVTQYWIANCDIYKGRPNMEKWMEECQKELSLHFEDIFAICSELRKSGKFHATIDVGQST